MRGVAQRLTYCTRLSQIRRRRTQRWKRAQTDEADVVDTTQHYDIADAQKEYEDILEWVHTNRTDVATKVWLAKYKDILTPERITPGLRSQT